MDLTFTEEQQALREMLRGLLEEAHPTEVLRALEDAGEPGFSEDLWRELASLDLIGLTLPVEHGGSGMGALETVVLYEELGRALATTPHLTTAILGGRLLADRPDWLQRIAGGEAILTFAWYEPQRSDDPDAVQLAAKADGDRYRLSGTKIRVPFAPAADAILTLARSDDEVEVFLVDADEVTATRTEVLSSDAEYEVTFDQADAERIAGRDAFDDAMTDVLIATAAWAVGGARRVLEMTIDYAKEREQFGRPIGHFQGVAHPIADTATDVTGAEVLVHQAAWRRAEDKPMGPVAAMAKLHACDVFRRATKVAHQVFGGIGFTTAIDVQLFFRRAKQLELTWFGPAYLEEVIAAAELDADAPFLTLDAGV